MRQNTQQVVHARRGRPRLGDFRLECILPNSVKRRLIQEERRTHVYRTRVAANVLCEWAKSLPP
jgi:hypothetical protein